MTNNEREEANKWFSARAKVATMPGAQKMFRFAIEALREMDRSAQKGANNHDAK